MSENTIAPLQKSISMARRWGEILVTSTVTATGTDYTAVELANIAFANLMAAGVTNSGPAASTNGNVQVVTAAEAVRNPDRTHEVA